MERANAYAERLARDGAGFGIKCTTSTNYLKDLLVTSGLNVQIIDETTRLAIIISIINNLPTSLAKSYFLEDSAVELLCQYVKNAAGVQCSEVIRMENVANMKDSEKLSSIAFILASHYFSAIEAINLVELGTLASLLQTKEFKTQDEIYIMDNIELQPSVLDYYKYLGAKGISITNPSFYDYDVAYSNKQIEVDVLTGSRARTEALSRAINDNLGKNIIVSCADPDSTYEELKALLSDREDILVRLKTTINLSDTFFGQQLINTYTISSEKGFSMTSLSDFAHNPYSNMRKFQICEYDKRLRGNTFSGGHEEIDQLMQVSDSAYKFLSLYSGSGTNIDEVLREIANIAYSCEKFSEPTRAVESASIMAIRSLHKMLFNLGFQDILNPKLFSWLTFGHEKSFGSEKPSTKITLVKGSALKKEAPSSYDAVISLDISSAALSAQSNNDSLDILLEKAGVSKLHTKIDEARLDFAAIGEISCDKSIMFLPLRSDSFDEVFTSFPAQEKFSITSDKLDEIVETLQGQGVKVKVFGEENLVYTCAHIEKSSDQCENRTFTIWENDLNHKCDFSKFLKFENVRGARMPILSPSQIESYISCPFKWFYERQISAQSLDYEFNSIIRGNIVHESYRRFYEELKGMDVRRLDKGDDTKYNELFTQIFCSVFDEAMQNGISEAGKEHINVFLESQERNRLYYEVTKSLNLHALFPKDYYVGECEFEILEKGTYDFAGAIINGRIDRIDYNDIDNSFLVIDYKAKVKNMKSGYFSYGEDGELRCEVLPSNIQTIIYASIFQQISKRTNKAALYAAYTPNSNNSKRFLNGIVDPSIASQFANTLNSDTFDLIRFKEEGERYDYSIIHKEALVPFRIQEVMEATEDAIAPYIERIVAGDISPVSSERSNCLFCSVSGCQSRK